MIQNTLNALSDPTRREIIKLLTKGEFTAGQIAEKFDISAPAISRHLAVLREAGIVKSERDGKCIKYALSLDSIEVLGNWIKEIIERGRENEQ